MGQPAWGPGLSSSGQPEPLDRQRPRRCRGLPVSDIYARQRFIDDPSFLSAVVRFDVPRLGDIRGLRAVHLQCHIGTDTISLARWARS